MSFHEWLDAHLITSFEVFIPGADRSIRVRGRGRLGENNTNKPMVVEILKSTGFFWRNCKCITVRVRLSFKGCSHVLIPWHQNITLLSDFSISKPEKGNEKELHYVVHCIQPCVVSQRSKWYWSAIKYISKTDVVGLLYLKGQTIFFHFERKCSLLLFIRLQECMH